MVGAPSHALCFYKSHLRSGIQFGQQERLNLVSISSAEASPVSVETVLTLSWIFCADFLDSSRS